MDTGFEVDLVTALKEVIDNSRWKNLGPTEHFKAKTCTRLYSVGGDEDVVVVHRVDTFYALGADCPHEGGPLDLGDIEDIDGHECLVCPWHEYDFRLDNGDSTSGLKQPTFEVRVVDDHLYIDTETELSLTRDSDSELGSQSQSTSGKGADAIQSGPASDEENEDTLCHWAVRVLRTADPAEKVRLTHEVQERWRTGDLREIGRCSPPDEPKREETLSVVAPGKIKRGKGGTLGNRIASLHSLANIEQWAVDLSWDIIARFAGTALGDGSQLPREFFTDFVKVAGDEAKHFKILNDRLHELGSHFGALPVHNGLWQSATETKDNLLARLAVVHMVHEARGLDVHPKTQERFAKQQDAASVSILEVIYTDEITHVAAGLKWFTYVCRRAVPPLECISEFHKLVRKHFRGLLKAPINEEGRTTAGMSKEWYVPLMQPANQSADNKDSSIATGVTS
ncbi:uncharacterized protein HI_0077-like [Asterias rubens]|uniref:uncharacterized protein HI_0077-like n=1 Tax=Asterias rubens TaxID=7604 RepID=UPI001455493E|nr:uncharacterized protein HI_0077-like [Asterias rubens]